MRPLLATVAAALLFGACHSPSSAAADTKPSPNASAVGTEPGHAGAGTPLVPGTGDRLAAFAER